MVIAHAGIADVDDTATPLVGRVLQVLWVAILHIQSVTSLPSGYNVEQRQLVRAWSILVWIVCARKSLKKWRFLEKGHAQDLQDFVGGSVGVEFSYDTDPRGRRR